MGLLSRAVPATTSAFVLAACGTAVNGPPPGSVGDAFTQRAAAVARAWAESDALTAWRTSFTPLQRLTIEPEWGDDGALKYAFSNGWRSVRTTLPQGPTTGTIRYAGGATQGVALVGARHALDLAMPVTGAPCQAVPSRTAIPVPTRTFPPPATVETVTPDAPNAPVTSTQAPGCSVIVITAARLTTAHLVTSRGAAEVPAWEFTVQGARTPLVRVAVAKSDVTEQPMVDVPPLPTNARIAASQSVEGVSGRSLSFTIGVGGCGGDVKGRAYETGDLEVVGGTCAPPPVGVACLAILQFQRVTITLAAPLGTRLVVDASTGQPVGATQA
jgi:hypothetical protein